MMSSVSLERKSDPLSGFIVEKKSPASDNCPLFLGLCMLSYTDSILNWRFFPESY